jgi:succinoglycan biosynthesis protein ExoA
MAPEPPDDRGGPFAGSGRVVVAVPALNEAQVIEGVLRSLAAESRAFADLKIVVADGGSTDGTVAIVERLAAEFPCIALMTNHGVIQSAGVNLVAKCNSAADILVRCDAHAVYPQGYLERLVRTLDRIGSDSVVVPMDCVGRSCLENAVGWVSDTPVGSGGSAHRGGRRSGFVDHGHHAAFRMVSFVGTGGYDESFRQNEDAEFDNRLTARGGRVFLDADIRIGYHPRSDFRGLWRQYFNYGFGRSRTARRHPATIRLRQLLVPAHLCILIASLLLTAATRQLLFLGWPLLYAAILLATSIVLAGVKRSICGLLSGPAAGVMHTGWAVGFLTGLALTREPRLRGASSRHNGLQGGRA